MPKARKKVAVKKKPVAKKKAAPKARVTPVAPDRFVPTRKEPPRMPVAMRRDAPIRPEELRPAVSFGDRRPRELDD